MGRVDSRRVGIAVLGPLTIDGEDSHGVRDRVVLEALVVRADEAVDKQVLADALWGEALPSSWPKMIQGCIVRLRRLLPAGSIETTPYGYRLVLHEDQVDARQFERMLGRARDHLRDGDADRAAYVVTEALALWRGRPFPDLDDWEPGRAEATRLTGLRMDAEELRVEAELVAGRSRSVTEDARALTQQAPFRERRWALLARALYQSGRQTEALDVLARARRLLRDELGLDPGVELTALEEAILRQDPELSSAESSHVSPVCPYRGLLPYEARDAESFFGRDADVAACLRKLRTEGVLAVVGPSGTGKSSLVRAGVIASLEREGTPVLLTTPGQRPLDSLADLPSRAPYAVLVVDQAEEAVTLCSDPEERAAYFARIDAYDGPKVFALRADRLGDLSTSPVFARLLERGLYLPGPMSEENLRAAIEGPARHAGLRLEPGLVDLLVREVDGEPGALPLLSHALRQTWELREGPTLTVDGYRRSGGIRDAVAQSAENLYDRLDNRQRAHLRDLFLRLVEPGDDSGPTRTRVPRTQLALDAAHDRLIDDLVDARLLSSDEGDVQLAHEALAREWPRLRAWLDEDVEGQRIFRHLSSTAETWDSMARPASELYRGVRLAAAVDWAGRSDVELTATEREFLDRSKAETERELQAQRRSNRRLRLSLAGVAVFLVAALVAGFLAVVAAKRSDRQAVRAATAARLADSRRLSAQALAATEPDLALLLAVEGIHRDDSLAARSTLYSILAKDARLRGVARGDAMQEVETRPGGEVVTGGAAGLTSYDGTSLAKARSDDVGAVSALALTPSGRLLAYAPASIIGEDPDPDPRPVRLVETGSQRPLSLGGFLPRSDVWGGALAFSADGTRLAAGEEDFDAGANAGWQVWDTTRPARPIRTVKIDGIRFRVALSPRGDTIYVATRGPDVLRAYDVDSGRLLARRVVPYVSERNPPLVLSPDGALLATSHRDGVAVFDARTLHRLFVLPGQDDGVSALAFSPDGSQLAAGYTSGTSIVWQVARQRPIRTFRGHSQAVEDVAFTADGRALDTVSSDGQLLSWDVAGPGTFPPARQFRENPSQTFTAVPSPDGRTVAYVEYWSGGEQDPTSTKPGHIQFRDVATGRLTPPRQTVWGGPSAVEWEWSPDSRQFALSGGVVNIPGRGLVEHNLQVWDPTTGSPTRTEVGAGVDLATFTHDGARMVLVSREGGTVTIVDRETQRPVAAPIHIGAWGNQFYALTPDDRRLYLPLDDNKTQVVYLATGKVTRIARAGPTFASAFSPDGSKVLLYDSDDRWGVMKAGDLTSAHPRWVVPVRTFTGGPLTYHIGVSWSAGGDVVETLGSGTVDLWDAHTLGQLGTLQVGAGDQVPDALPLPDGHTLLIAHPGGDLFTWDVRPRHLLDVACTLAGRNLTKGEWHELVGARAYRETCPADR